MDETIVVIAEILDGTPLPITYELSACAREIAAYNPRPIKMLVLGDDDHEAAGRISQNSGLPVIAVTNEHLTGYNCELYKKILAEILPGLKPAFICVAHTSQGADFAPGLAVRLNAACITCVEEVLSTEGKLGFARGFLSGKFKAIMTSQAPTTVLTVVPGAFKPGPDAGVEEVVEHLASTVKAERSHMLGTRIARRESEALGEAKVIVAAGRGVGKRDNLALIDELAARFTGGAVAGSRPVCDAGWLDYSRLVGTTGATVSPGLYLACGISGARQHTAGMQGADYIVAVSTDPEAAIFNLADVCIVEDLTIFIPVLLEELDKA